MSAQILVGNLPAGTTESEIQELFQKWGAEVQVDIRAEGNPDKLTAVVTLEVDAPGREKIRRFDRMTKTNAITRLEMRRAQERERTGLLDTDCIIAIWRSDPTSREDSSSTCR